MSTISNAPLKNVLQLQQAALYEISQLASFAPPSSDGDGGGAPCAQLDCSTRYQPLQQVASVFSVVVDCFRHASVVSGSIH
jgi:hypothetical protein